MCLVACTWSVLPNHAGEGAPSPLDKTLPSGSSCSYLCLHALLPAPACTTTCACSTDILLDLSFAMSGSGGYFASLAPAMSKVLSPGAVQDVVPSEVSSSLSVSKETCAFIPKNRDVIKPLSKYDVIILHSDWLPRKQRCPLARISFIFPCFSVQKGQMSSGFLRDRMLFHQLGACEYECFRLAGTLTADVDNRAVLFEIFAAGKYPQ